MSTLASRVKISLVQVEKILELPRAQALARATCELFVTEAISIFERQRRLPFQPTTERPVLYAESFSISRVSPRKFRVTNTEPGWNLTEDPTHPGGGPTLAGGYKTMRLALDALSARR